MEPCGLSLAQLGKLPDEEVVSHFRGGHADALAVIFNRYHSLIFTVAFKVLRDVGEAEDIMQAVFLELYKSVAQYDPSRGTLKVWILQFAYHRSINRREYLNVRKFYQHEEIDSVLQRPLAIEDYGMVDLPEIRSLLRQGLEKLTADQRKTLEAVFLMSGK